uniref:RNA helicase n=1 Tax=Denticeps clupeoides TaxID=299321 RepID=A0AAY4B674_9TELE
MNTCGVGLDFMEYLSETDRRSVPMSKNELRDVYNAEFRNRNEKDPNFSNVLYALTRSNKARLSRGSVHFNQRVRLLDQWRRPRRQNQPPVASPPPSSPPPSSSLTVPDSGVRARRKLAAEILQKLQKDKAGFTADKEGIKIQSDRELVDGTLRFSVNTVNTYEIKLFVENTGVTTLLFTYYSPLHWLQSFYLEDDQKVTRANPLALSPGEQYEIRVKFKSTQVGVYPATVAFEFKPAPTSPPFYIVRFIEAEHRTGLSEELAPVAPFKPCRINSNEPPYVSMDEGDPPPSMAVQNLRVVVPLEQYNIPPHINDLVMFMNSGKGSQDNLNTLKSLLESPLTFQNYTERFQLLLHLEEVQMHVDIKRYDMEDVPMERDPRNKRFLLLHVPGVAENRPSVLRGDHIWVTKWKERHLNPVPKYKGFVHRVELDPVLLHSSRLLDGFIDKMKFNVEFTVNRLPMRLQHRAVQLAVRHNLQEVLFPTGWAILLFDMKLERNDEQKIAVQNIVAGVSKPAPYLVFGPPGTGKTVTIVEAIKQLERTLTSTHILACAPSNSASDLLCEKVLEHVDPHKVYRLYASSRDPKTIPEALKDNCNLVDEDFVFPCKEVLMEYKILVTTVVTAGRLVSGGLPKNHFSHIFVDEAGHAVEPETIIGVAGLLGAEEGLLVLAGDPKQLGPILRSPFSKRHGLETSLLERLMKHNPLYQKDGMGKYNSRYVTKLLLNYRSHKDILKIPNELFYEGELVPSADEIATSLYCNWEHLPKRGFPLIFHGVTGKDEREGNSPSFFNRYEIEIVVDYLKKLLQSQGKKGTSRISPKEIGIIAPYRKQVEKIRQAIRQSDKELRNFMNIKELKVGSVEEFQGQERRVIIVSAVRSNGEFIKLDEEFNIGFLKNEKRFNVAMTRAKALLIVVGNPIILKTDKTWGRFLEYCTSESGYRGYDYASVEDAEDVVERLVALSIRSEVATAESAVQQYLDPEWRNEQ